MRFHVPILLACFTLLAACERQQVERVELGEAEEPDFLRPIDSPDTDGAVWTVTGTQRGIDFGKPGEAPLLTLNCIAGGEAEDGVAPQLAIIRHAPAQPGAKALFAVLGNGMTSRFNLDARLAANEWRWEGLYPANAPELQVFTGRRRMEATLPGGGTLRMEGSPLPREFIAWCRSLSSQPEATLQAR